MDEKNAAVLEEELRQFKEEKEKIKQLIGQIGGAQSAKREKILSHLLIYTIVLLFVFDLLSHFIKLPISLPYYFSLQISLFLVSLKIIWMINKQIKVEHFQFWILNSIDFRLNEVSKQVRTIEKFIDGLKKQIEEDNKK